MYYKLFAVTRSTGFLGLYKVSYSLTDVHPIREYFDDYYYSHLKRRMNTHFFFFRFFGGRIAARCLWYLLEFSNDKS